jgi:mannose-6-phosphate isomerase-like protein (cupin superfamily)
MKIVPKEWGEERWIVNRDYCGKLLILRKGFRCSLHYHKTKDETFFVNKGKVLMECAGSRLIMLPGDTILIEPGMKHRFTGLDDSEIFEFSTHHEDSDSYRDEPSGRVDLSTLVVQATLTATIV